MRLALSGLGRGQQHVRAVDRIEAKQLGWRMEGCLPCHPIYVGCALIIPMIIQTMRYDLKLWIGFLHESATYPPA